MSYRFMRILCFFDLPTETLEDKRHYKFVWKSEKSLKATVIGFLIVSLFSAWVVQSLVIMGVTAVLGETEFNKLIAKACGSVAGMVTNYFGYKFVFKKQPEEEKKPKTSKK